MSPSRQLSLWILVTLCAAGIFVSILRWEHQHTGARWSAFRVGNPATGEHIFRAKGCYRCHRVNGVGGSAGPELAAGLASGPDRLASAMWNHAPGMWEAMEAERTEHPRITQQEMSHLFAYLYAVQCLDPPGESARGRTLFTAKGCARCHAVKEESAGTPVSDRQLLNARHTPVSWARAMWNHPHESADGAADPKFAGSEMSDLLAYVRRLERPETIDPMLVGADPDRGWKLFHQKSCTKCHSVRDEAGQSAPELGPGRELPGTILQLAGSMWNHAPAMLEAMKGQGIGRPKIESAEMADLIAFLYSFRYYEPGGSPKVGEVLFAGRGCGQCHGANARGGALGPKLRGRGRSFSCVSLAAALWDHGPDMHQKAKQQGLPWPKLATRDIGDILAFLNSSTE